MTDITLIFSALLLGAVLRHLQGGLDAVYGLHRWQIVAAYPLICLPVIPVFWGHPWGVTAAIFAILSVLFIAQMTYSQDFSKPWKCLVRFGVLPALLAVVFQFWPAALVGPAISAVTWAWQKFAKVLPLDAPVIDGAETYWELAVGGFSGAAWVAAILYGKILFLS
jgi:hypothetical protein